jgi:hypothetical protein
MDNQVCTGSANEMIYEGGGEVAFVSRMVSESQSVGDRISCVAIFPYKGQADTWCTHQGGSRAYSGKAQALLA